MRTYILLPEASLKKVNDQIVGYLIMTERHISDLKRQRNALFNDYYSGKITKLEFERGIENLIKSAKHALNNDFVKSFDKNPAYRQDITQLNKTYGNFVASLLAKKNEL